MAATRSTNVEVATALGVFTLALDEAAAPISAANFLAYVDGGYLREAAIYRIVAACNQGDAVVHKIHVVQWGWVAPKEGDPPPLPTIAHEPTSVTGLRHRDGTLSMARRAPGTAGPAFFICIGDQPELDFGGRRNPDGQGFAAFGRVIAGMDVVRAIHARAEASDRLQTPIAITRVARVE
jgi:peptidyl-prolyl cis-trans isomerase A (cyclophilin A)